jgi:Mg-chelatase subunit ChlD/DNA-binding beta-propeller fold protein YncE
MAGARALGAAGVVAPVAALVLAGWQAPVPALQAAAGSFVVADTWQSAESARPPDSWRSPSGVDIGPSGRIYVADSADARVTVLEPDGRVARLDRPGPAGLAALVAPRHLAVDEPRERLYVADPGQGAVVVLGLDGERQAAWTGIPGPTGVAVRADGHVLVSAGSGELLLYRPDGERLARWPVAGPAVEGNLLAGLDVTPEGLIYLADGSRPRLIVRDGAGRTVDMLALDTPALDVAVEADAQQPEARRLWLATAEGIRRYDTRYRTWERHALPPLSAIALSPAQGTAVTVPARPGGSSQVLLFPFGSMTSAPRSTWGRPVDVPGVLDGPAVVQVAADGLAYLLDVSARIQRFGLDGRVRDQLGYGDPLAVDAAPDGTVYVTDGVRLTALAADGALWWEQPVDPAGLSAAVGLAFNRGLDRIELLDGAQGRLVRFSPAGTPLGAVALDRDASARTAWTDLDVDSAGRVWVLDRRSATAAVVGTDDVPVPLALPAAARRLAVGPDDTLFLLGRDGWVRRVDGAGSLRGAFDATRFDLAVASSPSDLSVDAGGSVYVTDRDAHVVTRFRWDAAAPAHPPPEAATACRSYPDKRAAPGEILLGETVQVRLTVRGGCGTDVAARPLDILLIIDRSGSMDGDKIRRAREAAMDFIGEVELGPSQVGLVSFNTAANLNAPLTIDEARLRRAITALRAEGGTRIDQGLLAARGELARRGRPGVAAVFILLSDGYNNAGPQPVLREAESAKRAGVEIFTINIQGDAALMQAVATDPAHYFAPDNARLLYGIFETIAQRITTSVLYRTITVTDQVPANMRYLDGSAVPPAEFNPATRTLRWTLADVPFNGFGLRYALQPLAAGTWPTNVVAWGDFQDGFDRPGRVSFPVPRVRVLAPTPRVPPKDPSPTPPPPTPTPARRPTSTPTEPPRRPIYLPLLLKEHCVPSSQHADVLLIIDSSVSMTGQKLAGAKAAAKAFVRLLALPADQVGVVSFNSRAWLLSELSASPRQLEAAIDALTPDPGTYINLGLALAIEELASARHRPENTSTLILLTDGIHTGDPTPSLELAAAARAAGSRIYAVGLGADVDAAFLEAVAGGTERLYLAPGPDDLVAIYAQIAGTLPCTHRPPAGTGAPGVPRAAAR